MFQTILTKIFGSSNERIVKQLNKVVAKVNSLEPQFKQLKDEDFRTYTEEYKKRVAEGLKLEADGKKAYGSTLNDILPEAFALVREASLRVLGLRPFDVQIMGGMVLNENQIAEMKTGEGKTLTALLPAYLNLKTLCANASASTCSLMISSSVLSSFTVRETTMSLSMPMRSWLA